MVKTKAHYTIKRVHAGLDAHGWICDFSFHTNTDLQTQNNTLVRVAVACPQLHAVAMHGVVALRPLSPPTRRATTLPPRLDSMGRVSRLCHSYVHSTRTPQRCPRGTRAIEPPDASTRRVRSTEGAHVTSGRVAGHVLLSEHATRRLLRRTNSGGAHIRAPAERPTRLDQPLE